MRPKISFEINKELDKDTLFEFLGSGIKAGSDFTGAVIEFHPELKNSNSRTEVSKYVDEYYEEHAAEIMSAREGIQADWGKIEKDFFNITSKYFNNLTWPEGKYVGYVAINPIGPRFISNCTWQTPYLWPGQAKGQIIHELLHFIFYEQMSKIPAARGLTNDQRWHLSEVFNDIVQKEPELVKLQGYEPQIYYPDHAKVYQKYLKIWQRDKATASFICSSVNEIKKDF